MEGAGLLTTFQIQIAQIFFGLKESEGCVVAGGSALLASDLVSRPTQDLDFFASAPVTDVTEARAALVRALTRRKYAVEAIANSPTFCRLVVTGIGESVLVDLVIDSPPIGPPTSTMLGPTLGPAELAGRKLLALFDRAEARDFADVYLLAERFGKEALVAQAVMVDGGFDLKVLAQMMRSLSRLDDDEIPLPPAECAPARAFFALWAEELDR